MKKGSVLKVASCILAAFYLVLLVLRTAGVAFGTGEEISLLILVPVAALIAYRYACWSGSVSRRFLRNVIDTVPSMIFVKDREGRFCLVNQALADTYGTTVSGVLGKTDADFNNDNEEVQHFVDDDLEVIMKQRDKFIPEEEVTSWNGVTRWYQTVKRPMKFGSQGELHVLGVSTDITETKRLQMELLQSQKMEAIGQLAGGVAHDFNNLLTAILGHSELLKIRGEQEPEVLRSADLIQAAANQAAALTAKLLAFARKGKHENVHVDVHAVIEEARAILERTMSGHAAVTFRFEAGGPGIKGDPVQLQQVIMNLVINARDAIEVRYGKEAVRDGEILVRTRALPRRECQDFDDLPLQGEAFVEIAVIDNGSGIPEANLSKVFEPFFTTKGVGKGTGMGLPMVFGIVKSHGGGLKLTSKEGQGTTVRILLPMHAGGVRREVSTPEAPVPGSGKILVVDDNTEALESTSSMLCALGYDVIPAKNGIDAMQTFEGNKDSIDLALVDLLMPKMGGEECFRVLRKSKPELRVIVSSGSGGDNIEKIREEERVTFLQKPYHLEELSKAVSKAMN